MFFARNTLCDLFECSDAGAREGYFGALSSEGLGKAEPMPPLAPVTSARFPDRSNMMAFLFLDYWFARGDEGFDIGLGADA